MPGARQLAVAAAVSLHAVGVAAEEAPALTTLNTGCLAYQGNGCHTIKDEATCVNSRDGRFFNFLEGRNMRAQPCVWCGGQPCESTGGNLCESFEWVIGNPRIPQPAAWIAANCLDGRTIQETVTRTQRKGLPSGPAPGDFEPVNGGDGQACRGGLGTGEGEKYGQWSYSMWTAESLDQCMSFCTGTCTGVEYKGADKYCEVWWDKVTTTAPAPGYQCYKKKVLTNWRPKELPPGAGPASAFEAPQFLAPEDRPVLPTAPPLPPAPTLEPTLGADLEGVSTATAEAAGAPTPPVLPGLESGAEIAMPPGGAPTAMVASKDVAPPVAEEPMAAEAAMTAVQKAAEVPTVPPLPVVAELPTVAPQAVEAPVPPTAPPSPEVQQVGEGGAGTPAAAAASAAFSVDALAAPEGTLPAAEEATDASQKAAAAAEAPVVVTAAPVVVATAAPFVAAPVVAVAAPAAPLETAAAKAIEIEAPGVPTAAPAVPTAAPASAPVVPTVAPVVATAAPAVATEAPAAPAVEIAAKVVATEAPEAATAVAAIGRADRDVPEWPAPTEAPAGAIGGRFVKGDGGESGVVGPVFWQDSSGKHPLPAGVRCSECGCDGANVHIVPQADVDAMPASDTFHCVATALAVPAEIPADGQFLIVEEVGAKGVATKQVYWQNATGTVFPVASTADCEQCGCDFPVRVADSMVQAAEKGGSFSCDMIPGGARPLHVVVSRGVDVAGAGGASSTASKDSGNSTIMWVGGIVALLAAVALIAFCVVGMGSKGKKDKKTRGTKGLLRKHRDADEEAAPAAEADTAYTALPRDIEEPAAPAAPVSSPGGYQPLRMKLPPRIAPPVYVSPAGSPAARAASHVVLASASAPVATEPRTVFDAIDRNGDGVISREEWQQYAFNTFDRNHDGQIDAREWREGRQLQ
eukprot:CAMPEP_0176080806 /NCGR_PEP_ID=MMETSP0120_2-20121206/40420_1 /TAXON_ID=160619 /ORGANISM="Kryptoperidinium foliaceum, Strain CCMP 1326" /LENGTH=916 /DNA_ID=CAMNT_0017414573 /DNA_START=85 /DNA_END=2835 /DNA_ORIENTATION=+